jgi:hypothetical protein
MISLAPTGLVNTESASGDPISHPYDILVIVVGLVYETGAQRRLSWFRVFACAKALAR